MPRPPSLMFTFLCLASSAMDFFQLAKVALWSS